MQRNMSDYVYFGERLWILSWMEEQRLLQVGAPV